VFLKDKEGEAKKNYNTKLIFSRSTPRCSILSLRFPAILSLRSFFFSPG